LQKFIGSLITTA
ncbi:hypothetical protein TIFTF001_041959, partial [Ficus carica]